ncbi:MAG: hypothetical protein LBR80_12090, partial [Deltaproteobacteria bacterium]|nr:hypothetical protein [Deltaproteobacteria bacterium]
MSTLDKRCDGAVAALTSARFVAAMSALALFILALPETSFGWEIDSADRDGWNTGFSSDTNDVFFSIGVEGVMLTNDDPTTHVPVNVTDVNRTLAGEGSAAIADALDAVESWLSDNVKPNSEGTLPDLDLPPGYDVFQDIISAAGNG